jgi:hypothetical protein
VKLKKKYTMTWAVFAIGSVIAFRTNADLGAWTTFGTFLLAAFAVSDVADKKLNGGDYHCEQPTD